MPLFIISLASYGFHASPLNSPLGFFVASLRVAFGQLIFYLLAAFERLLLLTAPDRNHFHSPKPIMADIAVFQPPAVY